MGVMFSFLPLSFLPFGSLSDDKWMCCRGCCILPAVVLALTQPFFLFLTYYNQSIHSSANALPFLSCYTGERKDFEVYSCDVSPDGSRLVTAAGGQFRIIQIPFTWGAGSTLRMFIDKSVYMI